VPSSPDFVRRGFLWKMEIQTLLASDVAPVKVCQSIHSSSIAMSDQSAPEEVPHQHVAIR
jgi:hypothetical protein